VVLNPASGLQKSKKAESRKREARRQKAEKAFVIIRYEAIRKEKERWIASSLAMTGYHRFVPTNDVFYQET
jgi:ribosomal protein S12 methylthiotransferase accessory factor YcaO